MSKFLFPEKILTQHLVVLGKTGSGKSSAMRYMVEHLLRRGKRVCIVDPKGDWYGLKLSADGKHPGFSLVAFGDFKEARAQDVPINARSGKQVAELIATGNRPALIGFRGWLDSDSTQFWIDFASTLFRMNQGDLYLVIDEVQNFAPKGKIMDPNSGKALHYAKRLLAEGRGLGITCLIASQRPQKVHNDVLTSCETLVAMRVIHEADRSALKEWIDGCGDKAHGKEVLDSVANMPRGDAYVWSPEAGFGPTRLHFPMFETFDSFAPPQLQKIVSDAGWAEVDLDEVRTKLAAVIEEHNANDPKELRKQIAEKNAQIAKLEAKAVEKEIIEKISEIPVLQPGQLNQLESTVSEMTSLRDSLSQRVDEIVLALAKISAAKPAASLPRRIEQRQQPAANPAKAITRTPDASISSSQQKILNALAWFESIGIMIISKTTAAFIAGVSSKSSGYKANVSTLSGMGLLSYPQAGMLALTEEGRALAESFEAPLTSETLHQSIYPKLSSSQADILRTVIAAYPGSLAKEDIAHECGVSPLSSGFKANISTLSGFGFVRYPQPGYVVAEDLLFLK